MLVSLESESLELQNVLFEELFSSWIIIFIGGCIVCDHLLSSMFSIVLYRLAFQEDIFCNNHTSNKHPYTYLQVKTWRKVY